MIRFLKVNFYLLLRKFRINRVDFDSSTIGAVMLSDTWESKYSVAQAEVDKLKSKLLEREKLITQLKKENDILRL